MKGKEEEAWVVSRLFGTCVDGVDGVDGCCYMALMEAHGASRGGNFVIFLVSGYYNGLNASAC